MPHTPRLPVSRALVGFIAVGSILAAQPARSQDSSSTTDSVLTNPGARSIGLGGAFAAIADDATAAFANPAGLVQILRPEISIEIRGTAARNDTGAPFDPAHGVSGLGFFSLVYPSRSWALALYSHQLGSVGFTTNGGFFEWREITVRSFASAASIEINEHLSLGAGLSYFDGDCSSTAVGERISDADWGVNAGVLWRPSPAWRAAAFYRQGPEFAAHTDTFDLSPPPLGMVGATDVGSTKFTIPDEYGVGVAWQPRAAALTIGFEWDRSGSAVDPYLVGDTVTEGGSEVHLGAEYAVLRWKPVTAFRAGFWREPARRQDVVVGSGVIGSFSTDDQMHTAIGFGLAFTRFQIDAGVDISSRAVIGSASIVYSF